MDASAQNIENGRKQVLSPAGLEDRHPNIQVLNLTDQSVDFVKLAGRKFDYIWVHALYDHIPHASIVRSMTDLSHALDEGGRFYATIFLNPFGESFREPLLHPFNGSLTDAVVTYPDKEYWHHTLEFIEATTATIPGLVANTATAIRSACGC